MHHGYQLLFATFAMEGDLYTLSLNPLLIYCTRLQYAVLFLVSPIPLLSSLSIHFKAANVDRYRLALDHSACLGCNTLGQTFEHPASSDEAYDAGR